MDKLRRKYGFSLVEILIAVAILGILAAVVVPLYESNTQKAKESAAIRPALPMHRLLRCNYALQQMQMEHPPQLEPRAIHWDITYR